MRKIALMILLTTLMTNFGQIDCRPFLNLGGGSGSYDVNSISGMVRALTGLVNPQLFGVDSLQRLLQMALLNPASSLWQFLQQLVTTNSSVQNVSNTNAHPSYSNYDDDFNEFRRNSWQGRRHRSMLRKKL